jgi:hypothetical protein
VGKANSESPIVLQPQSQRPSWGVYASSSCSDIHKERSKNESDDDETEDPKEDDEDVAQDQFWGVVPTSSLCPSCPLPTRHHLTSSSRKPAQLF